LGLTSEKNISYAQKCRIIATAAALDLISFALTEKGEQHSLSDEMKRLSEYADAIEASLKKGS
jgi:hypothetical protein